MLRVSVMVLSSYSRGEIGIGRGGKTHSLVTTGTRLMQPHTEASESGVVPGEA